jgi:hypothetical protein
VKLADIKIGEEYAILPGSSKPTPWRAEYAHRARAVELVPGVPHRYGRGGTNATMRFEIVTPGRAGWAEPPRVGDKQTLGGREVWWLWEEHQALLNNVAEEDQAWQEALAAIRHNLGVLGLHDNRGIRLHGDVISISSAELAKLADRAEHLVELERLIASQYMQGGGSREGVEFNSLHRALGNWADAHDFSMLDVAPPE